MTDEDRQWSMITVLNKDAEITIYAQGLMGFEERQSHLKAAGESYLDARIWIEGERGNVRAVEVEDRQDERGVPDKERGRA